MEGRLEGVDQSLQGRSGLRQDSAEEPCVPDCVSYASREYRQVLFGECCESLPEIEHGCGVTPAAQVTLDSLSQSRTGQFSEYDKAAHEIVTDDFGYRDAGPSQRCVPGYQRRGRWTRLQAAAPRTVWCASLSG